MKKLSKRNKNEVEHFTKLEHIWWGALTVAGQKRYDNKADKMFQVCKIKKGARVLEVGSGDGEFTKRIAKPGLEIVATDITPLVVKKGRGFVKKKNVRFKVEDATNLSFKSGSFDLVCGISILHHVDIKKAIEEAFRVLKKNGQVFFTEPNLLNPHVFLGLNIPILRKKMEFSPDETALIRWRVERLLKETGFRYVRVTNYDFLHPSTPDFLMDSVQRMSNFLEEVPVIKEISGSLIIWAKK